MGITSHATTNSTMAPEIYRFESTLVVNNETYFLVEKDGASVNQNDRNRRHPSNDDTIRSSTIVLGSDTHHTLLVQRIQELSSALPLTKDTHTHQDAYQELHYRVRELGILRDRESTLDRTPPLPKEAGSTDAEGLYYHVDRFGKLEKLQPIELDESPALVKRPQVRQFFHRGVLHRSLKKMNVPWLELFHDLLFVGALASAGHVLRKGYSSKYLGEFTLLFANIKMAWFTITIYNNQFHHHDAIHKFYTLMHMAFLMGMAVNAYNAFDSDPKVATYDLFLGSYLCVMYSNMIARVAQAYFCPLVKWHILMGVGCQLVPSTLYLLAASHVGPLRLLWTLGAVTDILGLYFPVILARVIQKRAFLALNIEHMAERHGLWVIICLGEVIVYLLFDNNKSYGALFHVAAILGLVVAFCIQWIYFGLEEVPHEKHALRRNFLTSVVWNIVHIPLTWCILVLGFAINTYNVYMLDIQEFGILDFLDVNNVVWTLSGSLFGIFICFAIISVLHLPVAVQSTQRRTRTVWVHFIVRIGLALLALVVGGVGNLVVSPFASGIAAIHCCLSVAVELFLDASWIVKSKHEPSTPS